MSPAPLFPRWRVGPRFRAGFLARLVYALAAAFLAAPASALDVQVRAHAGRVARWDIFELDFRHPNRYAEPFFDATVTVVFQSPGGGTVEIGGFHFGSEEPPEIHVEPGPPRVVRYRPRGQDLWKARFAPSETGAWRYRWEFSDRAGERAQGEGAFTCVEGRVPEHGFLRIDRTNPFQWVFDDGTPFHPMGLQDGVFDNAGTGSVLTQWAMEGPFRMDRKGRPDPPPGALYRPGPSSNPMNGDVHFRRYGRCGFNLFRFSQKNFSLELFADLDHWHVHEARMVDELLEHAHKYGFRVFYGLFGYQGVHADRPDDAATLEKVKRFVKYSADRWGSRVDVWELLNEQHADDRWTTATAGYLRSVDPYRHPIATSWERPELAAIEVNAPHWYQNEDERRSDEITASRAREWKKHGKPVVVGEQGNQVDRKTAPPGVGGVWDVRSALRMRLRIWTALFTEISFVFWNTSYAKDGHNMNLWIGPREREYVRSRQDFANRLGRGVHSTAVEVKPDGQVRGYALASEDAVGVYLHHFRAHDEETSGIAVTVDVPRAGRAYWIRPADAAILGSADAPAGQRTFVAPAFAVDLALLVTPRGAPDSDGDGVPNDLDPDDDGDGVADEADAFPLEPEEWADADRDEIGDVLDADDDGDGVADDANGDGVPDGEDPDADRDGVKKSGAIPWDAFPNDPKEYRDTDGDGVGDAADPDDDGDGWSDEEEKRAGADPLDRRSFPAG